MLYLLMVVAIFFAAAFATQSAPWWATAAVDAAAASLGYLGYLIKRSREARLDQRVREAKGKFYRALAADPKSTAEALGGGVATALWAVLDGAGVKIPKKAKATIKGGFHEEAPLMATLKALLAIATGKLELSKIERGQLEKNAQAVAQALQARPRPAEGDAFVAEPLSISGYKIVTGEGAVGQQFGAMEEGEKAYLLLYPRKAWVERHSFFTHRWQWVEEEIWASRISVNPRLILENFKGGNFVGFVTGHFPQFKLINGGVVQNGLFINEWVSADTRKCRAAFERFVGALEARLAANK